MEGESCPKTVFRQQKKPDNRFRQLSLSEPGVRRKFPIFLIMNFQTRSGAFEDCFNIIWKNLFMNGTYVPRNTTPLMPYAIFFFSFGTHMPTITPMANRRISTAQGSPSCYSSIHPQRQIISFAFSS